VGLKTFVLSVAALSPLLAPVLAGPAATFGGSTCPRCTGTATLGTIKTDHVVTVTDGDQFDLKDAAGNYLFRFLDTTPTSVFDFSQGALTNIAIRAPVAGILQDSSGTNQASWNTTGLHVQNALQVGGGSTVLAIQTCTSTTNVASIPATSCLLTALASVTGCTANASSVPTMFESTQPINGVMCVPNNAAGTLDVYCCNSTVGALDPPSWTFVFDIINH
jgi:hypothetical protein